MEINEVTAAVIVPHKLSFTVTVVKYVQKYTGTTVAANPSSGASSASLKRPVLNAMPEPSTSLTCSKLYL